MSMTRNAVARLIKAAGQDIGPEPFTYHDYLYELLADGSSEKPVTEQQWEMIADMQGSRRVCYASNVHAALTNIERRAGE